MSWSRSFASHSGVGRTLDASPAYRSVIFLDPQVVIHGNSIVLLRTKLSLRSVTGRIVLNLRRDGASVDAYVEIRKSPPRGWCEDRGKLRFRSCPVFPYRSKTTAQEHTH
jgi:hypothetical protein